MIYYHACPKEHTESILREGLLKSKSSLWKASGGAIYLTKTNCWMNKSDKHDILEIDLPEPFLSNTRCWDGSNGWEIIFWGDIPKEYIRKL